MSRPRFVHHPCGPRHCLPLDSTRSDPQSGEVLDAQYAPLNTAPVVECRPDVQAPSDEAYWNSLKDQATD